MHARLMHAAQARKRLTRAVYAFGRKHKSGTISRPLTARGMHEGESIEARLRDTTIRVEETVDLE